MTVEKMTENFTTFGLPEKLMQSLARMDFTTPTPIQAQAIPLALKGKDILGSAQTGTGKTGAFAIPLIARLMESPDATALIMTPTRELATQVMATFQQLIPTTTIKTALLIGGESMPKQFRQLQANPRLVVGTPGRINDHLTRNTLTLSRAHYLVLDETDRMLDMGFGVQIDKILKHMPKQRQTLLFSATLPPGIVKLSANYLRNPERITIGSTTTPVSRIQQENIQTADGDKYPHLTAQLDKRIGSVIVFIKTKYNADRMATKLSRAGYTAEALHGDLKQSRRDRVIQAFRDKEYRILVATDVAARGLDIPHIEHVINYDMPQVPEDYIHRIGRTARAGAEGAAVNLISPADGIKWRAIQRLMDPAAEKAESGRPQQKKSGRSFGKRTFGKPSGGKPAFGKTDGDKPDFGKKKPFGKKPFGAKKPGGFKKRFAGGKIKKAA